MVVATSDIAKPAPELRDNLAALDEVQTFLGVGSAVAAKALIDITETGETKMATLPRIRIGRGGNHQSTPVAAGMGGLSSGSLFLTYYVAYDPDVATTPLVDQETTLLNSAGACNQALLDAGDGLFIRDIVLEDQQTAVFPDEADSTTAQFVKSRFRVDYGLEGVSE